MGCLPVVGRHWGENNINGRHSRESGNPGKNNLDSASSAE